MKQLMISALIAAATFTFSTNSDARGIGEGEFRYYHFQCLDTNNKQLWFEISSTYDASYNAQCTSDGGTLKVTKVFW